jgi:hypothetical protein
MSVQSALPVRESGAAPPMPPEPDLGANSSVDVRWAAWIERGREHDRAAKRKGRLALASAAVIAVLSALFYSLATTGAR